MKIKYIFILGCLSFFACQNEVINSTPPTAQDVILPNSSLANLMKNIVANDGSVDDVLDNSSCFSIQLPVTIVVENDMAIAINSESELNELEAFLSTINDDSISFIYPITLIFNDYTEVIVENETQLETYIQNCENNEVNHIECIDFVYPVIFSTYDSNSTIINTVIVENDEVSYQFLETIENNENLVVSLNFPVTLMYINEEIIEANANQELSEIIEAVAEEDCNDNNQGRNCGQEYISNYLMSCNIVPTIDGYIPPLTTFQFLGENSLFTMYEGNVPHNGIWSLGTDDVGVFLVIDFESSIGAHYNGQWYIELCGEDVLIFYQDNRELVLRCEDIFFGCFESSTATLELCDNDNNGYEIFDLTTAYANCISTTDIVTYHANQTDATINVNPILNPQAFTNTTIPQTVYIRVERNNEFQIFSIALFLEDCTNNCTQENIDAFIVDCIWNITNYNGSNELEDYNFDFAIENQALLIYNSQAELTTTWLTSQTSEGVIIEFSNITEPNINVINGEWLITECLEDRLQLQSGNDMLIMERNCN